MFSILFGRRRLALCLAALLYGASAITAHAVEPPLTFEVAVQRGVARAPQLDVFDAQVADAKARGAEVLCGGARLPGPGNWYPPTVLTQVNHDMALMREESFGPLIGIQKVSSDDEAVGLMNDTRYGLTAGVFTRDEARATAVLSRVNAGSVYWNCCDRVSPRLPWSGVGDSGVGLTLSTYGIQTFTRPKAWHLRKA